MRVTPQDQTLPPSRALVPLATSTTPHASIWPTMKTAVLVGSFGLMLGVGAMGAYGARHALWGRAPAPVASAAMVQRLQDQVAKLQNSVEAVRNATDGARADDQLRGMRRSVEALKQEVEQVRNGTSTTAAQLAAKIDKVDHDPSAKLADIATRLDRMERDGAAKPASEGQGGKLADLSGRIDRLEKQVSAPAATGSIPQPRATKAFIGPVKPGPMPAVPQLKTEVTTVPATVAGAKPPLLAGWALRDVYDGLALVEGRDGDLREVQPGQTLPGAGEVRSIERRGRTWVVTTSRGVIGDTTF